MVSGDTSGLAPFSASPESAMMRGPDQCYEMSDEIDKSDERLCDTQGHWPPHPEGMESQKRQRFFEALYAMYIGSYSFPHVMEIIVSIEKTKTMTNTWGGQSPSESNNGIFRSNWWDRSDWWDEWWYHFKIKDLSEMSCVGWVMRGHVHFAMGPSLIPSLWHYEPHSRFSATFILPQRGATSF